MTNLTTRERRRQRTEDAILEAARQIINEQGIAALSMRGIAEQIDYSPAGLYEYFGSKEEIICAVSLQGHRLLRQYMLQADTVLPADEYMLALGTTYVRFAVQHPDYFQLMFTNKPGHAPSTAAPPPPEGAPRTELPSDMLGEDSAFPVLLQAIQRGIAEGVFQTRPAFGLLPMAYAAWAVVHGLALLHITHQRPLRLDFAALEQETLRAFLRGLAT